MLSENKEPKFLKKAEKPTEANVLMLDGGTLEDNGDGSLTFSAQPTQLFTRKDVIAVMDFVNAGSKRHYLEKEQQRGEPLDNVSVNITHLRQFVDLADRHYNKLVECREAPLGIPRDLFYEKLSMYLEEQLDALDPALSADAIEEFSNAEQ